MSSLQSQSAQSREYARALALNEQRGAAAVRERIAAATEAKISADADVVDDADEDSDSSEQAPTSGSAMDTAKEFAKAGRFGIFGFILFGLKKLFPSFFIM